MNYIALFFAALLALGAALYVGAMILFGVLIPLIGSIMTLFQL